MGDRRDSARTVSAAYRSLVGDDLSKAEVEKERQQREWIWEYVLKFCPEKSIIQALLEVFPIPDDSFVLKRMLLLKTLEFHLADTLLPERALDVLRGLAELGLGQAPGRDLLLAVMVELTVQHLRDESLDFCHFTEALEKHWGPSVEDTEDRYQDDRLESTRQEFQAVLGNHSCRDKVVRRYPREAVESMLTGYLDQSWADIGPTFLEAVAEERGRDASAQGSAMNRLVQEGVREKDQGPENAQRTEDDVSPAGTEPLGLVEAIRSLHESEKRLHEAVKDPLPEALLRATEVVQSARQNGSGHEAVQRKGSDGEVDLGSKVLNPPANAQGVEDISSPEEGTSRRVMLHRPSERRFSPLSPFDSPPQLKVRRRMRHMWTDIEETTLRNEVAKYGKGRWKFILTNNMDVFTNRTEVDLKDKWRNIERSENY